MPELIQTLILKADSIVANHFREYALSNTAVGVLLSGGIDSTVITSYAAQQFLDLHIFSMGTDQTKDRPFVDIYTKHIHKEYEWIDLTDDAIDSALPEVQKLLVENGVECSTMQMSLAVGYYLIFKKANELGVTSIVTGQGPDILFAGYHKYKSTPISALNEEIRKDLILLETDKKRDGAMAAHFGITLLNPYLEEDFVLFSLSVPAELKLTNGVEKYFMREWGKSRNVPSEIIVRPKKAFQYSTGLQKSVQRILKA